jgi:MoxR-like ATPase
VPRFTDTQAALAIAIAAKVPVLLTGLPGQGKTATINGIAEQYGLLLRTLVASQRDPADLNGLPYVDPGTGSVHLYPQQWAKDLVDASGRVPGGTSSILFFDEISTAPPALQAACLRILGERVVGDLALPDDVAIVLAQNPPEFAADGWDLAAPLANRVVHLDWELPADYVADGFARGFGQVQVPVFEPAAVAQSQQRARIMVGSFVKHRPELLASVAKTDAERAKPFASPRSWDFVSRLVGLADAAGATQATRNLLITGAVGSGPGLEFATWLDNLDLPEPEWVLAHASEFVVPDRHDKVYAVVNSVLSAYLARPSVPRWMALGQVLRAVADAGSKDLAVVAARTWAGDVERATAGAAQIDAAVLQAFLPILQEMGVFRARPARRRAS